MNPRALSFLIALAPAIALNAQPGDPPSGHPQHTNAPAAPTPVPLEFGRTKPGLRVTINGRGPFLFLLDTGAGATVLSQDFVKELGLTAAGTTRMGDPANPDSVEADIVHLNSIQVAGATFTGIDALAHDRSGLYTGADQPKGVLGYPLFAHCLVTLDYPAAQLSVNSGALPAPDGNEILEYHVGEGGIPVFQIDIAGQASDAHLDTGSPGGLAVPVEWESRLTLAAPAQVVGRARSVSAEYQIRGGTLQGQVHLGSHAFDNPRIAFHPGVRIANLGSRLLRDFRFTLDPANTRARFERVRPVNAAQPNPSSQPANQPPAAQTVEAEIRATLKEMEQALLKGEPLGVARCYTDDAIIISDRGEDARGREAIDRYWSAIKGVKDWTLEFTSVDGTRNLAVQRGTSSLKMEMQGTVRTSNVEYTHIWKRDANGKLRIAVDAYWPAKK